MVHDGCRVLRGILFLSLILCSPLPGFAQRGQGASPQNDPESSASLMVIVRDETGGANAIPALVIISRMEGGMFQQAVTEVGRAEFSNLHTGLYTVKVSAAGYVDEVQTINVNGGVAIAQFQLKLLGEAKANSQRPPGMPVLSPKAQKLAAKVLEGIQGNQLATAHASLEELYRLAPAHPQVNYLYGLYELRAQEPAEAKAYWKKTLELYPKHMGALLQLSQASLMEKKPEEAVPLLNTAMAADPAAWRPHAMMAEVLLQQKQYPEAVKEADRAVELGHSQADAVQPLLARALELQGDKERAIHVLQDYLKAQPADATAHKMLDALRAPATQIPAAAPPQAPAPVLELSTLLDLELPEIQQEPAPAVGEETAQPGALPGKRGRLVTNCALTVHLRDASGGVITDPVVLTLTSVEEGKPKQFTAADGRAEFENLVPGRYTIHAVADGYDPSKETIVVSEERATANLELRRGFEEITESATGGGSWNMTKNATGINVAKERQTIQVLAALRANKPEKARASLDRLYRDYPSDPNMSYLYAVYEKEMNDLPKAEYYWQKTVALDPKQFAALFELGHAALDKGKPEEAISYLKRAAQAKPAAWQPHALLVVAYSKKQQYDEARKEADQALELGRSQAAQVQPVLASMLAREGNREQAVQVLQDYLKSHPHDAAAKTLLAAYRNTGNPVSSLAAPEVVASWIDFPPLLPSPSRPSGMPALSPKDQRLFADAVDALRHNLIPTAREYLAQLHRTAPGDPDVNYVFGVCSAQFGDWESAKLYWQKTVGIDPHHLGALMELGHTALRENKLGDAVPYLRLAIDAMPTAWRPHALMAQALAAQGQFSEAITEADRALELGRSQALVVEPLLAQVLAKEGEQQRAIDLLRSYPQDRPDSDRAQKLLESLEKPAPPASGAGAAHAEPPFVAYTLDLPPMLPGAWRPADIDEATPPVEPGVACSLDDVLRRTSSRVTTLVRDLDRFTAKESLVNEHFDTSLRSFVPETREFNYLVSITLDAGGYLNVEEFRGRGISASDFPDQIATVGLPGLVLVFHPLQLNNFNFSCEGLARTSVGLAWQLRFEQRSDRMPTLQGYTAGGMYHPVYLKGRAWVAANSFQVVRLETDLMRPIREVHLIGEHTVIDYGPVQFRSKDVKLWLPQTADIYFDWGTKRVHRRHSFSDYMLFSVDDQQKTAPAKTPETSSPPPVAGAAAAASPAPTEVPPPAKPN
jgi:predicted Zn-dependent protease